jgi:hypothetical protein
VRGGGPLRGRRGGRGRRSGGRRGWPRESRTRGPGRNPFRLRRCRLASGGRRYGGLASFLDGEDLAALVVSALRADAVGQLALVAVGALGGADGVRKSWLRRLAVRCLEWRRFGFGIAVPFRCPARATNLRGADRGPMVQMSCAIWIRSCWPELRAHSIWRRPRVCSCRSVGSGSGRSAGKVLCSLLCRACGWAGREAPVRARHLQARDRSLHNSRFRSRRA